MPIEVRVVSKGRGYDPDVVHAVSDILAREDVGYRHIGDLVGPSDLGIVLTGHMFQDGSKLHGNVIEVAMAPYRKRTATITIATDQDTSRPGSQGEVAAIANKIYDYLTRIGGYMVRKPKLI